VLARNLQLALHYTSTAGNELQTGDPFSDFIITLWPANMVKEEGSFKHGAAVLQSPDAQTVC
jgi:hypothetical protein